MPDKVSPVAALPARSRAYGALPAHSAKPHWGMVVDAVICKSENNVPLGGWWNRILTDGADVDQPKVAHGTLQMAWLPLSCQQCENAPCVKVCPVGATYHRADGVVMVDSDRCIGCRYCMIACPYGVRTFNWGAAARPTAHETGMVVARPLGTVEKCTFCVQRLAEEQVPSCVWSCPAQARIFGDLNDPTSRVSRLARDGHLLLEDLGTRPSGVYLAPRRKQEL
jgi:molybdopterin-containing oxidoreductase family iron-sulfur binding subunit